LNPHSWIRLTKPTWLSDFNHFIKELKINFRSFDPKGEAEAELEQLCMHKNHQAMKYSIKFQQLSTQEVGQYSTLLASIQWSGEVDQEQYGSSLQARHCEGYTPPYNESTFPGALPVTMATTTT